MTMHKALHPRDDVERLYVSKKEGGRGLTTIQDSVDTTTYQLEDYIRNRRGRLITGTRNNTDITIINRKKYLENKNGKKNNCIDILSDKQAKSRERKLEHREENETLREKLNLFW